MNQTMNPKTSGPGQEVTVSLYPGKKQVPEYFRYNGPEIREHSLEFHLPVGRPSSQETNIETRTVLEAKDSILKSDFLSACQGVLHMGRTKNSFYEQRWTYRETTSIASAEGTTKELEKTPTRVREETQNEV